jgi:hypothetical protein
MYPHQRKCKNCGRAVKQIDGLWVHYWWRDDPDDDCRRVISGSLECMFVGRPDPNPTHAEVAGGEVLQPL